MRKWCVCAVEYYFDRKQDESRYMAVEVLQVYSSEEEAKVAVELMNTVGSTRSLEVISSDELLDSHR